MRPSVFDSPKKIAEIVIHFYQIMVFDGRKGLIEILTFGIDY